MNLELDIAKSKAFRNIKKISNSQVDDNVQESNKNSLPRLHRVQTYANIRDNSFVQPMRISQQSQYSYQSQPSPILSQSQIIQAKKSFQASMVKNEVLDSNRSHLDVIPPIQKNPSAFKKTPSTRQITNTDQFQPIKSSNQVFNLGNKFCKQGTVKLMNIISKSQQIYYTCRKLAVEANKLWQVLLQAAPPMSINDDDSGFLLQQKIKQILRVKQLGKGRIDDSLIGYSMIQQNNSQKYFIIQIDHFNKILLFAGIDVLEDQLLSIVTAVGLLFHDKALGYFTEYQKLFCIIKQATKLKLQNNKLFMMSLMPDTKLRIQSTGDIDVQNEMLKMIDQRHLHDQLQNAKFQRKHKPSYTIANTDSTRKVLTHKDSTPLISNLTKNKPIKILKKFGLDPLQSDLMHQYDSHSDLFNYKRVDDNIKKFAFYAMELGYVNIKKNRHLIDVDPDIKEEFKIFGEEQSGTEYPIWIRILYQHQQTQQILPLQKIYFFDPSSQDRRYKHKDFFSYPILVQECSKINQLNVQEIQFHQTRYVNQILDDRKPIIKPEVSLERLDNWYVAEKRLQFEDIFEDTIVKGAINETDPKECDSSCSEFDEMEEISIQNPLFVKQIQSYHIYKLLNVPVGGYQCKQREEEIQIIDDQHLDEIILIDITKGAFHFKEQFLNDKGTISPNEDIQHVYPYGEPTNGSSEDFSDEDIDLADKPLQIGNTEGSILTKTLNYVPPTNKNFIKMLTFDSDLVDLISKTSTPHKQKNNEFFKRRPISHLKFLEDLDVQIEAKGIIDFDESQKINRYIYQENPKQQINSEIKVTQQNVDVIFGTHFEMIPLNIREINKKEVREVLDSSDELSFDEQPFQFSPNEFLEKPYVPEEDKEDLCGGMLVLKKELLINYENGAGISYFEINHKDKYIYSLEGFDDKGVSRWKVKFFVPDKVRKFAKQTITVSTKGRTIKNVLLTTRQIGNKKLLNSFQIGAIIRTDLEEIERVQQQSTYREENQKQITEFQTNSTPYKEKEKDDSQNLSSECQECREIDCQSPILEWNQGQFCILIRYSSYYKTFGVDYQLFIAKLNKFMNRLNELYPRAQTQISIFDARDPAEIEAFEVLIQGVGPLSQRKGLGNYPLFCKTEPFGIFLFFFEKQIEDVYLNLNLLIWSYGSSVSMSQAQKQFLINENKNQKNPYRFIKT